MVGEAATGGGALAACALLRPDVVLLDLRLPDLDGVEVCRMIRERDTGVDVLALTTYDDPDLVDRYIRAGVTGYVVKDVEQFELKRSIRLVARGQAAIDPKFGARLMERLRTLPDAKSAPASLLTTRQRGILSPVGGWPFHPRDRGPAQPLREHGQGVTSRRSSAAWTSTTRVRP